MTFQPFIKCWMYLSTLKRPNTFEMVKLKANNFCPVCKFKCSVDIWTTEHQTGEIKQLIFLCALHLPVIYTTHLLPHWAEVGLVFEDYLTSLHWYQMSLTAANQDRGIVKKGCAEKDTAFRPFSYSSATIHVHYTVLKKSNLRSATSKRCQ